jgi:DnaK suppressor protein
MLRKYISASQKVFGPTFYGRLFRKRTQIPSASRTRILRSMLLQLRDQELRRLKELVRNEALQKGSVPGDESDYASLHENMELNVSLMDLTERRLSAILAALERLEEGRYGICGQCGEEILSERLRAMPAAVYCVDCQADSEAAEGGRGSAGWVMENTFMISGIANSDAPNQSYSNPVRTDDVGLGASSRRRRRQTH